MGVSFRLLDEEFTLTWKTLSNVLGFHALCSINLDYVLCGFDGDAFWNEISSQASCFALRTNEIQNPMLHFLHRLIAMTLFPRADV